LATRLISRCIIVEFEIVVKKAKNGCVNGVIENDLCSFVGYDKASLPTGQTHKTSAVCSWDGRNW